MLGVLGVLGVLVLGTTVSLGVTAPAQERRSAQHPEGPPRGDATIDLGGWRIAIEYGRPYVRGRRIFGDLVPYGRIWRTGADEATTLRTDGRIVLAGIVLDPGAYHLLTVPREREWELIVRRRAEPGVRSEEELGRGPMTVEPPTAPIEQLTIRFVPMSAATPTSSSNSNGRERPRRFTSSVHAVKH